MLDLHAIGFDKVFFSEKNADTVLPVQTPAQDGDACINIKSVSHCLTAHLNCDELPQEMRSW